MKDKAAQNVAKFLYEEIICRHGCPGKIVVDGGSENKRFTSELSGTANGRLSVSSSIQRTHRAGPRSYCQFFLEVLQQRAREVGPISFTRTLGRSDLCSAYD